MTGLTWVNSTNVYSGFAYYDIASARPIAIEGVCYWNTTAGFKMLQCYNSTHWVLNNGTMAG